MAGTNNFKAFATGGGANVLSQADYEALATLIANGFTSGVADSQQVNKAIRQGSVISAAIGTIIANANLNALDDGDIGALANTLLTVFQRDGYRIGTVGGTVDAITAAFTPAIGTLTEGLEISLYCSGANTSTTPTLKADATLEKTIVKGNNLELDAGDILAGWHKFKYSTTLGKWVLINPATGVTPGFTKSQADALYCGIGYMLVRDEKAQGTDAGGTTAGATATRTLNTVSANTISGASLSENQITLPAGTYRFNARAPAFGVNSHKAYLYSVTGVGVLIFGSSENGNIPSDQDPCGTTSVVSGRITLGATTVIELRHYTQNTRANDGFGSASGFGTEVYSSVEIVKEA